MPRKSYTAEQIIAKLRQIEESLQRVVKELSNDTIVFETKDSDCMSLKGEYGCYNSSTNSPASRY